MELDVTTGSTHPSGHFGLLLLFENKRLRSPKRRNGHFVLQVTVAAINRLRIGDYFRPPTLRTFSSLLHIMRRPKLEVHSAGKMPAAR